MKSWYNNTFDDTVATSATSSKSDIDWMVRNRLHPTELQYANLYISDSLVKHANFPGLVSYAFQNGIRMGRAYSAISEVDTMMSYNASRTNINEKLWFAVTELEPYNTGDYAGMTSKIQAVYPRLKAAGLRHVIYMGWPTDAYWATIVANCDEINLHCYRPSSSMTGTGTYGYVSGRLKLIADTCKAQGKIMPVNLIYSCEPSFAYDYFKTNAWGAAHSLFLTEYAAKADVNMKSFLLMNDFSIFVTQYAKQIKP